MPPMIYGPGSVAELGDRTRPFGRTALLVTGGGSLARSGMLARLTDAFASSGIDVHPWRVAGEPSPETVDGAVQGCRDLSVDVVVAVGGGSVLDAGKAIAAMLRESGSVVDYLEGVGRQSPSGHKVPMIAVPTTSGTGSEATKNAVISQVGTRGFKKSLRHDNFIPDLAVLDPCLCTGAPPSITAACGMDALTQLIESYVSDRAGALTDALALDGMRHLVPALPAACGGRAADPDCRGAVAYGAFLSGVTLAHAGLGVVHGVAGPMGGLIPIPHGAACANLLPAAVKFTIANLLSAGSDDATEALLKFARIGRIFGAVGKDLRHSCRHLVDSLYAWIDHLPVPPLGAFGLTTSHISRLVALASNKNNPRPLSPDQIESMIRDRC
jgi:alcohol dehydrogenase class IV